MLVGIDKNQGVQRCICDFDVELPAGLEASSLCHGSYHNCVVIPVIDLQPSFELFELFNL